MDNMKSKIYKNKNIDLKNNKSEISQKKEKNKNEIIKEISKLLKQKEYIHKVNVEIKTNKGEKVDTSIIGQNKKGMITIENKIINYDEIIEIKKKA